MSLSSPAVVILAILSSSPPAAGTAEQTIPESVRTGLKVSIVDERGVQIDGRVEGVSDSAVRLAVRGGTKDIPIEQIVRIERPDGVWNGALTGLGIGLSMGLIGTAADPQGGALLVSRTLGNGVVCAGIGALLDAAIDGRKTLYERGPRTGARVTPIIDRGVRAVAVSVSW
jgi:hypothetical protein